MKSKITLAVALIDIVCTMLGIRTPSHQNPQPLMELKIEEGVPYGKTGDDLNWVKLGDAIAPPVEWVNDDVGRRNEAVTLYKPSEIHAQMVSKDDGWLVVTYGRGVAAADTYVYKTSDGGKTWNECTPPPLSHYGYVSNIGFIDEERLLIGGRTFNDAPLVFTADGGSSWRKIPTPELSAELKSVKIEDNVVTIILGWKSFWIMRSEDLGDTWEVIWSTEKMWFPR